MTPFLREIHDQPRALRDLLAACRGPERETLDRAAGLCAGRPVVFTGMGSSCHAALAVLPRLAAGGLAAQVVEAGELRHYGLGALPEGCALVAVSQSGESVESVQVVRAVAGRRPVVALTNAPDSPLARGADAVLPLHAGAERSISTKTYTNTLALLHLLAVQLSGGDPQTETARLERVAQQMQAQLEDDELLEAAAGYLEGTGFLYFVGRGPALAAAHQGALTFNEGARLPTCALPGGSFRHGPLELAGAGFTGVFLAPAGPTADLVLGLAREVDQAGGRVVVLTDTVGGGDDAEGLVVPVPGSGEDLFSLRCCLPLELLLHHMARHAGLEAGRFRHIGKVTRRE